MAVLVAYGGVASRGSGLGKPGPGKTPLSRITATPPMIRATTTTSGTHARLRILNAVTPDRGMLDGLILRQILVRATASRTPWLQGFIPVVRRRAEAAPTRAAAVEPVAPICLTVGLLPPTPLE